MPWNVTYLADVRTVVTEYNGVIGPMDLEYAFDATLALARTHETALLVADCLHLTGGHSFADLFNKAKVAAALASAQSIREALVLPKLASARRNVEFWETACINRGLAVRSFATRDEALAWLRHKPAQVAAIRRRPLHPA